MVNGRLPSESGFAPLHRIVDENRSESKAPRAAEPYQHFSQFCADEPTLLASHPTEFYRRSSALASTSAPSKRVGPSGKPNTVATSHQGEAEAGPATVTKEKGR